MTPKTIEQGNAPGPRAAETTSGSPQAEGNQPTGQGSGRDYVLRDEHRRAVAEVVRERERWKQRSRNLGQELEAVKQQLPGAEELSAYKRWVDTHEQAQTELATQREKLDQEHGALIQAHQQELGKAQAAIEAQQRYIEQLLRENRIIAAAERANVANAQAVAKLFGPYVQVERGETGDYQTLVTDENGQVLRDIQTHQPVSVEEGLARYLARQENGFLLKAPSSGGSGAGQTVSEQIPLDLAGVQRRLQKVRNRQEFEAILKAFNRRG